MKTSLLWKTRSFKSARNIAITLLAIAPVLLTNGRAQTKTPRSTQPPTVLYTVVDLGPIGGELSESAMRGLNNLGQTVGRSYTPDGSDWRAVFWASGSSAPLELIGGGNSSAFEINGSGQIVGTNRGTAVSPTSATYWADSGSPAVALANQGNGLNTNAIHINAGGQIIGHAYNDDGSFSHVLFWNTSGSSPVQLPCLPGALSNTSLGAFNNINDAGQVVAGAFDPGFTMDRAVFWADSSSPAVDLGTLGIELNHSFAESINNNGKIVGEAFDDKFSIFQAIYWANSTSAAVALSGLNAELSNSAANVIDDRGRIVGQAFNGDSSIEHAVRWANSASAPIDLNDVIPAGSGWVLQEPRGINASGVIAGRGTIGGHTHGFLLVPRVLYSVRDLGPIGGNLSESVGRALNNLGQITGRSYNEDFSDVRAVFWAHGSSAPAELIGGSNAYGINDGGQIVGDAFGKGPTADQAVFWPSSSSSAIALSTPIGGSSNGLEINNAGQIVGNFFNDDGSVRALYWNSSSSSPVQLPGLPNGLSNSGLGGRRNLNDAGQVVGGCTNDDSTLSRATLWGSASSPIIDLGALGNDLTQSFADGINSNGQIVGEAFTEDFAVVRAVYWTNSNAPGVDLGALGGGLTNSEAQGINNAGKIVGHAYNDDFSIEHATLWVDSSSPALDLNDVIAADSDSVLQFALVINEKGEIAGHGTRGGHAHGFALIPRVQFLSAVSRKTHGASGTFDIPLPLDGSRGIECRTGGASGNYQVVVTFAVPVTFTTATVSSGTGLIANTSASGNQLTLNLSGVGNAQNVDITLAQVTDGTDTADLVIPMSVLAGDTNGSGGVNGSDIAQTKALSGQAATASNFRSDITADGAINGTDVALVKSRSGTVLP
ncbi:MAG: dockerin type I domain-containing protein [Chthoniobacterales bacterium]